MLLSLWGKLVLQRLYWAKCNRCHIRLGLLVMPFSCFHCKFNTLWANCFNLVAKWGFVIRWLTGRKLSQLLKLWLQAVTKTPFHGERVMKRSFFYSFGYVIIVRSHLFANFYAIVFCRQFLPYPTCTTLSWETEKKPTKFLKITTSEIWGETKSFVFFARNIIPPFFLFFLKGDVGNLFFFCGVKKPLALESGRRNRFSATFCGDGVWKNYPAFIYWRRQKIL